MTEEELKQKAENFIINRYKIAECYREDNAETREYMRMDVHSQYEEEYQLYLEATKELQEEINKQENYRLAQDSKISFLISDNEQLKKQLKAEHTRGEIDFVKMHCNSSCKKVKELETQIEKLTKELDEYKSIDKRLICNHKYFTSDIKNNNLAVICHSILDCDKCGRWEEE